MKLAVFDIDGTLVRPYPTEDSCFAAALRSALALERVDEDWTSYPNVTDSGLLHGAARRYHSRDPTGEESDRFRALYLSSFRTSLQPDHGLEIAGAAAFVAALRERDDWRVAVATGNFTTLAHEKLERARCPCLDLPMATADDAPSRATLVRLAVERARAAFDVASFDHVVSIGDAPWDLSTARELRVPFLAVGPRCAPPTDRGIVDYLDSTRVLGLLERAICW